VNLDDALRLHLLPDPGGCVLLAVTTSAVPLHCLLDSSTKSGLLLGRAVVGVAVRSGAPFSTPSHCLRPPGWQPLLGPAPK
jgi:hypothetical protein